MARSAPEHETVTPTIDPLIQARRRFLGALVLFGTTLATLPFLMDAQPPASLSEPSIEVRDDRNQVLLTRPAEPPPVAPSPATVVSAPPEAPPESLASVPATAAPPTKPAPPTAAHSPVPKGAESAKERPVLPPVEQNKAAAAPTPSTEKGEEARGKAGSGNAPVWSTIPIQERARAEAALRGVTGPGRPLEQFWYLQAGAFKDREAAEGLVLRLRSAGLPAYLVVPSAANDGGWYRVRVAPYLSESDAKAAAQQVGRIVGHQPSVAVARILR